MLKGAIDEQRKQIPITAKALLAFGAVWEEMHPYMRWFSKQLTLDKRERADLVAAAMEALWDEDPTRFDFRLKSDFLKVQAILILKMHERFEEMRPAGEPEMVPLTPALAAQLKVS